MRNVRWRLAATLSFAMLAGFAAATPSFAEMTDTAVQHRSAETKDRMSPDQYQPLLAIPLDEFSRGELASSQEHFEIILKSQQARFGANSVEVADTISAFGVLIYNQCRDAGRLKDASGALPYLRRAIDVYRLAFGPSHPEVAVALNDYADVERVLMPDDPPSDVDASLQEAFRIRFNALGPADPETVATMGYIAEVMGLPSRTGGDETKIQAAASMFGEAIRLSTNASQPGRPDEAWLGIQLAKMYLKNNRLKLAADAYNMWKARCEKSPNMSIDCEVSEIEFEGLMRSKGYELASDAPK